MLINIASSQYLDVMLITFSHRTVIAKLFFDVFVLVNDVQNIMMCNMQKMLISPELLYKK